MKNILFLTLILCISCVQADKKIIQPAIPLFVADLHTYRVRNEIIRIISTYETHSSILYIERIETPEFKLLEQLTIDSLTLDTGEKLSFENISGVSAEKIDIKNTNLSLLFEYFPARGYSFLVDCTLPIGEKEFEPMQCTRKERTD